MKTNFKIFSWVLLINASLPIASFAAETNGSTSASTSASATAMGASPRVLFQKYCSICHGEKGDGKSRVIKSMDPPPRDFTSPQAAQDLTRKRMIESVTNGRPGTAMVSHKRKLNDTEIESIVSYIRSEFMIFPPPLETQSVDSEKPAGGNVPSASLSIENASAENNSVENTLGKKLFKKNCSACHGDNGNTAVWARSGLDPAPRDFTAPEAKVELSRQRMINSVTNGRPGTAMMPFTSRLSSTDIEAVVSYIRSSFMHVVDSDLENETASKEKVKMTAQVKSAKQADDNDNDNEKVSTQQQPLTTSAVPATMPDQHAKVDMSAVMPNGLNGDSAKGKDFYMNNCYVCHGKKGDGKGPRSHFITPRPRNFTNDESRQVYNRPRLFDAIQKGKKGTVMPAWGKVLNDQQIANVAEFVFKTFIQEDNKAKDSSTGSSKDSIEDSIKDSIKDNTSQQEDTSSGKKKANRIAVNQTK